MDAERARLAIKAIRVSYASAERKLVVSAPQELPQAQTRALARLDALAIEIEPDADGELLRMLAETRRRIVQQA